jgi:carbon-monoxide dehydrogenase medium subunit
VARTLDAEIEVEGPGGRRTIPAADFFETTFTTALRPDELVTGVRFPVWDPAAGFAVEEIARRHGDFALAGAVCGVQVAGGRIERVALGLIGMNSVPERADAVESELVGSDVAGLDLDEIGAQAVRGLDPPADVHASGKYRKRIGATLVSRALATALSAAQEATRV